MPGNMHERALWPSLPLAATSLAVFLAAAPAGCTSKRDGLAAVKQEIAASLRQVLNVEVESIACPEAGDLALGFECIGKVRGAESFIIEVAGRGDAGALAWKPRGHKNIEYQLALGMKEKLRNQPERVTCPPTGDLAKGFECQVVLPGGIDAQVAISAGKRADRFVWTAGSIVMPGPIEERIAKDLGAKGKEARVSCGSELHRSVPKATFQCAVSYDDGKAGEAEVRIIDNEGHVQYQLSGDADNAGNAGDADNAGNASSAGRADNAGDAGRAGDAGNAGRADSAE